MVGLRKSTVMPPSPLYAFMMFMGGGGHCVPLYGSLQPDKNVLTGLKEAARKNELLAH
jgi:hypothetical protein